jgi:contractile injection system tube protein
MAAQQKAWLCEIAGDNDTRTGRNVQLQFNPETLRITYAAQTRPNQSKVEGTVRPSGQGDVPGSAPDQHTGSGSTRLSVQVWFDVTSVMLQGDESVSDVRELTEKVTYFIQPKQSPDPNTPPAPPRVQFAWGTIIFSGEMDSLDESLELFSTDGVPLRASMNIGISKGRVQIGPGAGGGAGGGAAAGLNLSAGIGIGASASLGVGTQPLAQAEAGVSLQAMASASFGSNADWQAIATANGIENPRQLQPGQLINLNARASDSASASVSASASFSLTGE